MQTMRNAVVISMALFVLSACTNFERNDGPPVLLIEGGSIKPDTFVSSDILVRPLIGSERRLSADCAGETCTYDFVGIPVDYSLDDAVRSPATGSFTMTGMRNGVMMGTGEDMLKITVPLVGKLKLEFNSYAGWMKYGGFAATYSENLLADVVMAVSTGLGTQTSPPVSGQATWTGAMAGKTYGGETVVGNAELTADFSRSVIGVELDDISDVESNARYPDMNWSGLPMRGGTFIGDGIEGRFYGPNHEEVGGTFERDRIVGADSTPDGSDSAATSRRSPCEGHGGPQPSRVFSVTCEMN